MNLELNESLVFRNLLLSSDKEVLKYLSEQLFKEKYVHKEYIDAIQKREQEYPTGLPSPDPGVAIPHANFELVETTTLAIATLKEPVEFRNMENNEEMLPIKIVIMMAIKEPHGQVEMLQKIVGIIQNESLRKAMVEADSDSELLSLLEKAVA